MYVELAGAPFMPELLGWDDAGEHPLLAIEDLSDAHWPPPWRAGDVDTVLQALGEIAAVPPPAGLPPAEEALDHDDWERVRADPRRFLATGLCTAEWFDAAYDTLAAAAAAAHLAGDALCHFDVRSDNLCLRGGRALLVDWNWAAVGDAEVDVAAWLPSLHMEGGPAPWEILPGHGEHAAWFAGFFCSRAGEPPPEGAQPSVRELQRRQGEVALDWAVHELGLPPR